MKRKPLYPIFLGLGVAILIFLGVLIGGTDRAPSEETMLDKSSAVAAMDQPMMILRGIGAEVTRRGEVSHKLSAREGKMFDNEAILDLRELDVSFYRENEFVGHAEAAAGRVWLADRKDEGIGRNDVMLRGEVDFLSSDGWLLRTPQLTFQSATGRVRTDSGYIKQRALENQQGWLIGKGKGFEIDLEKEQGTFQRWTEHGNPARLYKSDTPELRQ